MFCVRRSGVTLLEAVIAIVLFAAILGMAAKLFSGSSQFSEKIGDQQMIDRESLRFLTFLRADCRSARSVLVQNEALEITRFGFDQNNNIQQASVSYVFVDGNMVREENGNTKMFEFKRWETKKSDLTCRFDLASPTAVCVKVFVKNSGKPIIDERVFYETQAK